MKLIVVTKFCKEFWPDDKSQIPEDVLPYFYHCCDISELNWLLLFGNLIVLDLNDITAF